MKLEDINAVYFIGAGGIGMSALVRFFLRKGLAVGGYDHVCTPLTKKLEEEGAQLHYDDGVELIPEVFKEKAATLVVYTPAIPADHSELTWFRQQGFELQKRAQVLGTLTKSLKGLCVAGTHGKTTTSAMIAHLLEGTENGCNAFLGGITKNYGTNYLYSSESPYVVIEADEFDRSFHQLRPFMSVVTATDPDHLDIYGTKEAYLESFSHYTSLIQQGGALIMHTGLEMKPCLAENVRLYTYGRYDGDFHAENDRIGGGEIIFDLVSPIENIKDVKLGVPVSINIENGIAAIAMAQLCGVDSETIKDRMATYEGVVRRFDFKIKTEKIVLLSDYAHHPEEIKSSIKSLREVFQGRKITGIFQPHLYTRTRDFYKDFAQALSLLDEVVLTEIYPARELPIEGITSRIIYDNLRAGIKREIIRKADVVEFVKNHDTDVLVILGAGDLDDYMPLLEAELRKRL